VEKYCRAGQATDDNMAHTYCMLDNKATNTLSENLTQCFSIAAMVAQKRLNVTLHVRGLSCYSVIWRARCVC